MSKKNSSMLYDCDRCMFTFKKKVLRKQRGMHLCDACFDTVLEIEPVNIKWRSSRDNSTNTAPVTSPTTFTITANSALTIARSQNKTREGTNNAFEMQVSGNGGSVWITEIGPMPQGTILTLIGASSTAPVYIPNSAGLDIRNGGVGLAEGSTMTLVYNLAAGVWIETSRMLALPHRSQAGAGPSTYNEDFIYNIDVPYIGV